MSAGLSVGEGLVLAAVRSRRGGLRIEVRASDGRRATLDARAGGSGSSVESGALELSHVRRDADDETEAGDLIERFAAWMATLEEPLEAVLGRWLDARPRLPLGADGDSPMLADAFAVRAPDVPGPLAEALPVFREATRAARSRDAQLAGVPVCLGGERAPSKQGPLPACAGCLDAPECGYRESPKDPGALRPRRSESAMTDALAVLAAFDFATQPALDGCAMLGAMDARAERERGSWELSWKTLDGAPIDGARVVLYQDRDEDPRPALETFVALAVGNSPSLPLLEELCMGLPCHVGFACTSAGRLAKLYVQLDGLSVADRTTRSRALVDRLGADLPTVLRDRKLYCVGLTVGPEQDSRVRIYEDVSAGALPDDALGDARGGRAWDLTRRTAAVPTAHVIHYSQHHLSSADAAARIGADPAWLDDGLVRSGARYYLNFIAHLRGGSRTLYADIGPRPRSLGV